MLTSYSLRSAGNPDSTGKEIVGGFGETAAFLSQPENHLRDLLIVLLPKRKAHRNIEVRDQDSV